MGSLTTFTLSNASVDDIASLPFDVIDTITYSHEPRKERTVGKVNLTVLHYVHSSEDTAYVMRNGVLVDATWNATPEDRAIMRREYAAMKAGTNNEPLMAPSLEEALVVVSVYNDHHHEIRERPRAFLVEIAQAAEILRTTPTRELYLPDQTMVQPPLRRSAEAIYVSSGNCVRWFDSHNPTLDESRSKNKAFYNDRLKLLCQAATRKRG